MKRTIIYTATIIGLIAGIILAAPISCWSQVALDTVWVAPWGSDEGSGTRMSPYETINHALISSAGRVVTALPGVYNQTVNFYDAVELRSEKGADSTIIDPSGMGTPVTFAGPRLARKQYENQAISPIIDGFTITCTSCGTRDSAAVHSAYMDPVIRNNKIINNIVNPSGGTLGGGIYVQSGDAYIYNNIIAGNTASQGAGIYINSSSFAYIYNNTILNNTNGSASNGAGVHIASGGNANLRNNIIAYNKNGFGIQEFADDTTRPVLSNTLFFNNDAGAHSGYFYDMTGLIYDDPRFFNFATEDYRLRCGSPAFNSGLKSAIEPLINTDLAGHPRVAHGDVDLGALEFIDDAKVADFTTSAAQGCVPLTVSFFNTSTCIDEGWLWDFGDGSTAVDKNTAHAYTQPGVFSVTLNALGAYDTATLTRTDYVTVHAPLVVDFDDDTAVGCPPFSVTFTAVAEQSISTYLWDFGDGATSGEPSPTHEFTTPGPFTVSLIAENLCGPDTVIKVDYITTLERSTVTPQADAIDGCQPVFVNFDANASGPIISYNWFFGDGNSSQVASPAHTYTSVGRYGVSLVVTHDCGTDTAYLADSITVRDRPAVDFTCPEAIGFAPYEITFTDHSLNQPSQWSWDFGDGTTATLANPTHIYKQPGLYDVSLTASNECGEGTRLERPGCINVAGFSLTLGDPTQAADTTIFPTHLTVILQSTYPNSVYLEAVLGSDLPYRGSLTLDFADPIGRPEFQTDLRVVPSGDLPSGTYSIIVSAVDSIFGYADYDTVSVVHQGESMLAIEPDSLDFDSVVTGETMDLTVQISNIAPTNTQFVLTIQEFQMAGTAFSVAAIGEIILPPDSVHPIRVHFAPQQKILYTGALRILSDDPVVRDTSVFLRGRGIPEQNPPIVISTHPDSGATDILISDTIIVVRFSEPIDTVISPAIIVESAKLARELPGQFFLDGDSLWFRRDGYWVPFDSLSVLLIADRLVDSVLNRLDGDRDGLEEGSPADDYRFYFLTGPGVYPGDTDDNREVDERDVLPLGRFWMRAEEGKARPLPYESFTIQPAYRWSDSAATYADANGDGVIDSLDVCPILEFWSATAAAPLAREQEFLSDLAALNMTVIQAIYNAIDNCPDNDAGGTLKTILSSWLEQEDDAVPGVFELMQNYPNPFNARTVITYTLSSPAEVELVVFNTRGEKIAVLAEGFKSGGRHVVVWDGQTTSGRRAASGMYFCRLKAGDYRQTRKMTLLK